MIRLPIVGQSESCPLMRHRSGQKWFAQCVTSLCVFFAMCLAVPALAVEKLPPETGEFFATHCIECHEGDDAEASVVLAAPFIDWQASESIEKWQRVYHVLRARSMPPAGSQQPADDARDRVIAWLEQRLVVHAPIGGTMARRLNRLEYENTIRALMEMPDFSLPDAFPSDDATHGFDNVAEGLILSPPLMAQYLQIATRIADDLLPPASGSAQAKPRVYEIGAKGLGTSMAAGAALAGNRYRLSASRNMASAAGWPIRFEATQSGVYRLTVHATTFQSDRMHYPRRDKPFRLSIYARPKTDQVYAAFGELRPLAQFMVDPAHAEPETFTCEVELLKGEVFGLRWEDGPAFSDPPSREYSTRFLAQRLTSSRLFYAAMLKLEGGPRGMTQPDYYDAMVEVMKGDTLDLSDPRLDRLPEKYGGGLSDAPHNWIKAFVHEELHRHGPALDITDVSIEGPVRLIEDDETRARKARTAKFMGTRRSGWSDRDHARSVLERFLPKAFRRPVTPKQLERYVEMVIDYQRDNPEARLIDGLHLAVRRALISPSFLFRATQSGRLDDYDLAARLSYFLTSMPPDAELAAVAARGELSDPDCLRRETRRLLNRPESVNFVRSFTGQWLGTRMLKDIMPDPRLLPFFDTDRESLIQETELFFADVLRDNRSLETLIDPDFSYRNAQLNKIYGGDLQGSEMRRIALPRGGRQGGILGLGSVMMATANGVDTQPILRGVWLLENVFGMPTPPPPDDVPAISPNTSGTTTLRQTIEAHRADESCARCHDLIDPLGLVLENFDPVGRWRDHYPVYRQPANATPKEEFYKEIGKGTTQGPPVDAKGALLDGTQLHDVTDLKRYLQEHIDLFARCLTEKLLVYATGRPMSFGDRRVIDEIVADRNQDRNGLRDLVEAIVQSEAFRVK